MRLSQYFLPVLKEDPQEAQIVSHRLMLRAGMIKQVAAGIYSWLPLGLRVLRNIENIIREEMNKAGAIEVLMPSIQPAELWKESGRYDAYGKEMLRITDRHDHGMLFGPTHEEVITDIFRKTIKSYKELPKCFYQVSWKFRDEIRPRFGVMRGREFLMKDAYSFDISKESAKATYEVMYEAYLRLFKRLGLTAIPVRAETGAIGGNLSHEFQILADTGESDVYYDKGFEALIEQETLDIEALHQLYAAADEMHDADNCPIKKEDLRHKRGIEVGHVFNFGTKYSDPMRVTVTDDTGKPVAVEMGSYGIGVSRLVGAIIECFHDDTGIIWPDAVAPYQVGIINLRPGDTTCDAASDMLYQLLNTDTQSVLYDDRDVSAGVKFSTFDLIGIPKQIIIGPKGLAEEKYEYKIRKTGKKNMLSKEQLLIELGVA